MKNKEVSYKTQLQGGWESALSDKLRSVNQRCWPGWEASEMSSSFADQGRSQVHARCLRCLGELPREGQGGTEAFRAARARRPGAEGSAGLQKPERNLELGPHPPRGACSLGSESAVAVGKRGPCPRQRPSRGGGHDAAAGPGPASSQPGIPGLRGGPEQTRSLCGCLPRSGRRLSIPGDCGRRVEKGAEG